MMEGRKEINVELYASAIIGNAHLLIPRRLTHVSKGRAERFVSDTGAIFRARLHLDRCGQKWLKPETISPDTRD